ncbi:hypothetical protein [Haloplanus halophilus]|uniref:hypothetical protein n=1 Tax=Haloplanus halophilus TaxID=2949993 RepID=UPI00203F93A0|nr:hypothetical protein [Haloplanus sp. GDY1]
MTVTMETIGDGLTFEREVSESTALKIMELTLRDDVETGQGSVAVSLSGEGIGFDKEVSETTGVELLDVAVHDGRQTLLEEETGSDGLPDDFFDSLSKKQRIMLKVLLDADGEWLKGKEIRRRMREDYDADVGQSGRASAGIIAGLTRKYGEDLRRDVIEGRWADETHQNSEHRIGDKYKEEIRKGLEEQ